MTKKELNKKELNKKELNKKALKKIFKDWQDFVLWEFMHQEDVLSGKMTLKEAMEINLQWLDYRLIETNGMFDKYLYYDENGVDLDD